MKSLLIATTNLAKLGEMQSVFEGSGVKTLGLKDFSDIKLVEESGDTFLENALLKAKGYFIQTKISCLVDDGGLMVDYLDGAPGVNSNRWVEAIGFDGKFNEPSASWRTCKRKKFPGVSPRRRNSSTFVVLEPE